MLQLPLEINDVNILDLKSHVQSIFKVLQLYNCLTDSYAIEFFIRNHWQNVPAKWRNVLQHMSPYAASEELFKEGTAKGHSVLFPLSLLAFKACCLHLPLPRSCGHEQDNIECTTPNGNQSNLIAHVFRKHVNPKKQHEIKNLSQLIVRVATECNSSQIVDMGSGQGHLSRFLSICHDLRVTTIETNEKSVVKARQYDNDCVAMAKRLHLCSEKELPAHLVAHIHRYISSSEFTRIVGNAGKTILLTGLHACGDLSATMINTFVNHTEITSLVSVACCYMKLTDDTSMTTRGGETGYPMSTFVASLENHRLSHKARKTACHANEKFLQRMRDRAEESEIYCYQAVLEFIIRKYRGNILAHGIQTLKQAFIRPYKE